MYFKFWTNTKVMKNVGHPNGFPITKSIVPDSEFTKCFFEIREAEEECGYQLIKE